MARGLTAIVLGIDAVSSLDDEAQLRFLEEAIDLFFQEPRDPKELAVWFRLFERFPEDDGYEMFWAVLHGIEALPGIEPLVVESVRRRPSRFPVQMLNRMLNAGTTHVEGASVLELLESVASNPISPQSVREDAQEFIAYQRGRTQGRRLVTDENRHLPWNDKLDQKPGPREEPPC